MECLPKSDAPLDQNIAEPLTLTQNLEKYVDHIVVVPLLHLLNTSPVQMLHNGSVTLNVLKANHSVPCNTANASLMKNYLTCSVRVDKKETNAQLTLIVSMDFAVMMATAVTVNLNHQPEVKDQSSHQLSVYSNQM